MAADVVELLDSVDRAVVASEGIVAPASVARAEVRTAELRRRRGFQGETLVLAIAGGTGTGKSSLMNAIAREPVASVSRLRPHTEQPTAWIPESHGPGLDDLLDDFSIENRSLQTRWPGLALIDLPDMDSVAEHHRLVAEDLIPRVDGVVWVLDPTKYGDPTLHREYLEPLSEYRGQFIFVLNKIDTLNAEARLTVLDEVRDRLAADGYPDAQVFLTAAAPVSGDREGVEALEAYLGRELDAKRVAMSKWLIDIARELKGLADEAGVWDGATVELRQRWTRDRDAAAVGVLPGHGPGSRSDALCRLEDLVAMIAVEVGPVTGSLVRSLFPEGSLESAVDDTARAAIQAADGERRKRRAGDAALVSAKSVLDRQIGFPLRSTLNGRARFGATLVEAVLNVAEAEANLSTGGL